MKVNKLNKEEKGARHQRSGKIDLLRVELVFEGDKPCEMSHSVL